MKKARKLLALVLAVVMLLMLTACGEKESDADAEGGDEQKVFDAKTVLSQLEVTEYTYHQRDNTGIPSEENEVYLIIKNNSMFNINVQCILTTYDEKGEIQEIKYEECLSLGSLSEDVCVFEDLRKYVSYEYELIPEEEKDYACVSNELTYEFDKTENMVYVTITNKSEMDVDVYVYIFCFKNGEMKKYAVLAGEYGNHHVDSGRKITCEANIWFDKNYDDYKLIVKGRESR